MFKGTLIYLSSLRYHDVFLLFYTQEVDKFYSDWKINVLIAIDFVNVIFSQVIQLIGYE